MCLIEFLNSVAEESVENSENKLSTENVQTAHMDNIAIDVAPDKGWLKSF